MTATAATDRTTDPAATAKTATFSKLSYFDAIILAEQEEMERDERVILMGEDVYLYAPKGFGSVDESRIKCMPISENSFAGMAVGAAMAGLRPIVDLTIASFMYLASDQIINQAGKLRYMTGGQMQVPAVFRCSMWNGSSVAAQHSDRPYPLFMNAPGLKIIAPSTASDMKGLLKSAIRDDDPVVVFESNALWSTSEQVSTDPDFLVPIGKADIKHPGSDVTIVSISSCLLAAMAAAETLAKEGISAEVIDLRTLRPIDYDTVIASVMKTNRCVTVEEGWPVASMGNHLAATIMTRAFDYLDAPVLSCTGKDVPMPYAANLEKHALVTTDEVVATVKQVTYR